VNLGDTSFLDAIAFPGGLIEEIGQGTHDNRNADANGLVLPQITDVNSVASLTHLAWISRERFWGHGTARRLCCPQHTSIPAVMAVGEASGTLRSVR
jgi:hypothetical protein